MLTMSLARVENALDSLGLVCLLATGLLMGGMLATIGG
jgi:hypothetical protein